MDQFRRASQRKARLMKKLAKLAVSDEGFVFDPSTGDSYLMNRVGTAIVRGLQRGRTDDEVVKDILKEFDCSEEKVTRDVADFTDRLKSMHLL